MTIPVSGFIQRLARHAIQHSHEVVIPMMVEIGRAPLVTILLLAAAAFVLLAVQVLFTPAAIAAAEAVSLVD